MLSVRFYATAWTVAHQAPLPMGFSSQEYWSGLPCRPAVDLPDLGIEPACLSSPALAGVFFTTSATEKDKDSLIIERMPHKVEREMSQCSLAPKTTDPASFKKPFSASPQASGLFEPLPGFKTNCSNLFFGLNEKGWGKKLIKVSLCFLHFPTGFSICSLESVTAASLRRATLALAAGLRGKTCSL